MFRFSYCVVAVGHVPSSGIRLTGSESPSWRISVAVTFRTNSGAFSGTVGGMAILPAGLSGTFTCSSAADAPSTALKFIWTTASPFLP